MSAMLFDANISHVELEREIDRMMQEFDRIRKRVTGRHQVRTVFPSVVALPSESFLEQHFSKQFFSSASASLPEVASPGAETEVPSRPTWEMVSEGKNGFRGEPTSGLSLSGQPGVWKKPDGTLRKILVKPVGGITAEANVPGENTAAVEGPSTVFFLAPPPVHLDQLDIASMSDETLRDWVGQIRAQIVRGELSAILEAVYWASPQSNTPHAIRYELVRTLYTSAMDTAEVCHLALRLVLEANEPFEPVRRLSLDFLIRCFRVFGMYQSEVLEALRMAADPQTESRESVRLIAFRFLCQIMGNHPPVRQWLYQVLWLRREPSLMCRMILLESILLWIQERDASERERFEGLYLLQRTLEDERESFHVRFSIARKMLDSHFTIFPPDVLAYLREKIFPLCRQIVCNGSGHDKPSASGELSSTSV